MLNMQEPVTIYPATSKALRGARKRLLCIALPVNLTLFVMLSMSPLPLDGFTNLLRWMLLAELPLLYFMMARKLAQQTKPIVSLSSQGITVNALWSRVGFLRWDEIKDVHAYSLGYRFVGITLNDPKTVYRRIGLKRSWILRMNGAVVPLYKLFRIRVAPINIPQEFLPMSADELTAQIQAYRDAYA